MSGKRVGRMFVLVGVAGAASYAGYKLTKRRYVVSKHI